MNDDAVPLAVNELAHKVIGAAIEVHRHLGPGHLENVYEEAMCIELADSGLAFERQHPVGLDYKGRQIGNSRLDLLVDGQLIVELKAVDTLAPIHTAQALSYLRITGLPLALLINFNVPVLKDGLRRVIQTGKKA